MDGEQGTAQGNDGHWDFFRGSVCDCVAEKRARDRMGESKVKTSPGRMGGLV